MTHCNDQLIDQLLTQAEQEGRCLIPPSTAIRKALLRRTGSAVVSPMPGLFARKMRWNELNRAQRHCEIIRALAIIHPDWTFCSFSAACLLGLEVSWRHLNVVHVCSSTKPSARPGAHIQRHQIEPAGAIRLSGISVTPPHPNGHRLPAANRFCRRHAHCRFGNLKARPYAGTADGGR